MAAPGSVAPVRERGFAESTPVPRHHLSIMVVACAGLGELSLQREPGLAHQSFLAAGSCAAHTNENRFSPTFWTERRRGTAKVNAK